MALIGNGEHRSFKVIVANSASHQVKSLFQTAKALGLAAAFMDALKRIGGKLQADADEFGEPSKNLAAMQIRKAIILPIVVEYGVFRHRPLVLVRRFMLLPQPVPNNPVSSDHSARQRAPIPLSG